MGLGTEISKEEVYGPVNVRVVELEKEAGYPRVIVGKGLLDHLAALELQSSNDLEGRHTKRIIDNCRGLFKTDASGITMLDPMGKGVRSVQGAVAPEMIIHAYRFVVSQEAQYAQSDEKLHRYYQELRHYCESRLGLWGIEPTK